MVVHGDDYSDEKQRDMYKVPIERGIFRTVPYTKGISTTEIIRRVKVTVESAGFGWMGLDQSTLEETI